MDLVMEMAYELEAEGLYGAEEKALSAEDIAPVLEALQSREVSLNGFWDLQHQRPAEVEPTEEQL